MEEDKSAYPSGTHDRFTPLDGESMRGRSRFDFAGEAIFMHPWHADCGEETAVWAAGDGGVVVWRWRRGWLETAALRETGDGGAAGDWRRHRLGLDRAQGQVRPSSGPARPTGSGSTKGQRWSFWNVSLSRLLFFLF